MQLRFAADQRVQLAFGRPVDEVHRVGFQGAGLFFDGLLFGRRAVLRRVVGSSRGKFMGDHPKDVQPGEALFVQKKNGVRVLLHENGC